MFLGTSLSYEEKMVETRSKIKRKIHKKTVYYVDYYELNDQQLKKLVIYILKENIVNRFFTSNVSFEKTDDSELNDCYIFQHILEGDNDVFLKLTKSKIEYEISTKFSYSQNENFQNTGSDYYYIHFNNLLEIMLPFILIKKIGIQKFNDFLLASSKIDQVNKIFSKQISDKVNDKLSEWNNAMSKSVYVDEIIFKVSKGKIDSMEDVYKVEFIFGYSLNDENLIIKNMGKYGYLLKKMNKKITEKFLQTITDDFKSALKSDYPLENYGIYEGYDFIPANDDLKEVINCGILSNSNAFIFKKALLEHSKYHIVSNIIKQSLKLQDKIKILYNMDLIIIDSKYNDSSFFAGIRYGFDKPLLMIVNSLEDCYKYENVQCLVHDTNVENELQVKLIEKINEVDFNQLHIMNIIKPGTRDKLDKLKLLEELEELTKDYMVNKHIKNRPDKLLDNIKNNNEYFEFLKSLQKYFIDYTSFKTYLVEYVTSIYSIWKKSYIRGEINEGV